MLSYLLKVIERRIMNVKGLKQCLGESRFVLNVGMGILRFFVGKVDFYVNEKLFYIVKNSLFFDFRVFCCRYFRRILVEVKYGQRKIFNVCNLRGFLFFIAYFIMLGIIEIEEIFVGNKYIFVMDFRIKRSK